MTDDWYDSNLPVGQLFTPEQKEILDAVRDPPKPRVPSVAPLRRGIIRMPETVARITAAAGSITYLTFSKAAARDGQERLYAALSDYANPAKLASVHIDARTIHSCAYASLKEEENDEEVGPQWTDDGLKKWIAVEFVQEIKDFMSHCYEKLSQRQNSKRFRAMARREQEQVVVFILKTLDNFCRNDWTLEEFDRNKKLFGHIYRPAVLFHEKIDAEALGFSRHYYTTERIEF
eukprot:scaffold516_cov175-Amphora_coffeaeformis.AAC.34